MKKECLVARITDPNIAQLYSIDFDQNLINNIRILCTKYQDSFQYFIPKELFCSLRNGDPIPSFTAVMYDRESGKSILLDPLEILKEQEKKMESIHRIYLKEVEIRVNVEGYDLPSPQMDIMPLSKTVLAKESDEEEQRNIETNNEKIEFLSQTEDSSKRDNPDGGQTGDDRASGRKKGFFKKAVIATILISVIIVVFLWFRGKETVARIEKALTEFDYLTVVSVYNENIFGNKSKEKEIDWQIETAIANLENEYYERKCTFQEAGGRLEILTNLLKTDLSEKASEAFNRIQLQETSTAAFSKGSAFFEQKDYINAVKSFVEVQELSDFYGEAQKKINESVDALVISISNLQNESEYMGTVNMLESLLNLLPENSKLVTCKTEYENSIRAHYFDKASKCVEANDYKGAFQVITAALNILVNDEEIRNKNIEYQKSFVEYIKTEVKNLVQNQKYDDALSLVNQAKEQYSCDEFNTLYTDLEKKKADAVEAEKQYTAKDVDFLKFTGSITGQKETDNYSITAPESGYYRCFLSDMVYGFNVTITVYNPDGSRLAGTYSIGNGEGVTCKLKKGNKYSVKVKSSNGTGNYTLKIGQQKPTIDLTSREKIFDSIEFTGQRNKYKITPEYSGVYRFSFSNVANGFSLKLNVYDNLGYKVKGYDYLGNNDGLTVDLTAGEEYDISVSQNSNFGDYTLNIGKQLPIVDVTGKTKITGKITYTDQENVYTYTADSSGSYNFMLGDMVNDFCVELYVYDELGYKVGGASNLGNGDQITVQLESGQTYKLDLIQYSQSGDYSINITNSR